MVANANGRICVVAEGEVFCWGNNRCTLLVQKTTVTSMPQGARSCRKALSQPVSTWAGGTVVSLIPMANCIAGARTNAGGRASPPGLVSQPQPGGPTDVCHDGRCR